MAILLPDIITLDGVEQVQEVFANDRFGFVFDVTINDIKLDDIGYGNFIDSFMLEQSVNKIDLLKIRFVNNDRIDDELFAEGNEVRVKMGYESTSIFEFGSYIITKVKFNFDGSGDGILLYCLGESVSLALDEKRRIFESETQSDIVSKIAKEYDLSTDIDTTNIVYESIIQSNETDWSLIKRFADMNGFVFFVINGVLHFHKIRVGITQRDHTNLLLDFGNPISQIIKSADIDIFWLGKNSLNKSTHIGKFDSSIQRAEETPQGDIDGTLNIDKNGVRSSDKLSHKSIKYLVTQGISDSADEIQKQLDANQFFDNFIIRLKLVCEGVEDFVAGKLIEINGFDRFSGTYYISDVVHSLSGGLLGKKNKPYTAELTCWLKFSGGLSDPIPETYQSNQVELLDVTNNLKVEKDTIVQ